MNKNDLTVAAKRGFPTSENMVNQMLLAMNTAFIKKEEVRIKDFGIFKPYKSKLKRAYDFKNKRWVPFEGSWTIKFRLCPEVKRRMNQ